jgi:hypothetical protein
VKFKHKQPCKACPWRLIAPAGHLGGNRPETYADLVCNNEIPPCHNTQGLRKTPAMCAGALAVSANACILPHNTLGAREARGEVGKRADCFTHPAKFYEHHAGKPYVTRLQRMLDAQKG